MTKAHQRRLDALFIQIGRCEARARKLKNDLRDPGLIEYESVAEVEAKLEEAWRILSDRKLVI
jgi:hypothetical protein